MERVSNGEIFKNSSSKNINKKEEIHVMSWTHKEEERLGKLNRHMAFWGQER